MKLLILGDVCPTEITASLFEKVETDKLFSDTKTLFDNADFSFVNLECAITDSENAIEKFGPNLKAPKNTAKVLKDLGVSLVGLSNNHIFDFGIQGYKDTIEALDSAELAYTGFGKDYQDSRKNFVFEKDGQKICFITVCEHEYSYALDDRMGSRPFDCYDTVSDVRNAKAECDKVVVIYHGGKEHCRYPSPRMVKLCRALIDNGADVVVGQHSHCICCYENYGDGHILYGQGNFNFVCNYENYPDWDSGVAVIYDTETNDVSLVPTNQTEYGIELSKGDKKTELDKRVKDLSDAMKNGSWIEGWRQFCFEKEDYYNGKFRKAFADGATEKEFKVVAHLLDCEAHHDVISEIHKTTNHTNEK